MNLGPRAMSTVMRMHRGVVCWAQWCGCTMELCGEHNPWMQQHWVLQKAEEKTTNWSTWVSLVAQGIMNPPAVQETWVQSLGGEDPLEEGMATHSSILPGESYGQRSLAGYSPRGSKKSDMTEHLIQSTGTIIGHYKTKGILTQFGFNSISSWPSSLAFTAIHIEANSHFLLEKHKEVGGKNGKKKIQITSSCSFYILWIDINNMWLILNVWTLVASCQ